MTRDSLANPVILATMSRHTAAHITAACAILFIAGAPLLARPPAAEAGRSRQDETATTPTRTRRPTATSPPGGVNGVLPRCSSGASIRTSTREPRVGEVFTITARSQIVCPNFLTSSAALFVVGGVPLGNGPGMRASMAAILDALAEANAGPIARLVVGDDTTVPTWVVTPDQRAALEADLRALDVRPGGTARAWADTLARTNTLFRALGPTYRPLLVVIDGRPPAAGVDDIVQDLAAAIASAREFVGHSVLIDLSDSGWMLRLAGQEPGGAIIIRDTQGSDRTIAVEVNRALALIQAPLIQWTASLLSNASAIAPLSAVPMAEVGVRDVHWTVPAEGHAATFEVNAVYRALYPTSFVKIDLATDRLRLNLSLERGPGASIELCVQPRAPGHIDCPRIDPVRPTGFIPPEPTRTPTPSRTPTPDGTPFPRRTPSATPDRPPNPTAAPQRRIFVPNIERS